ncbi:uncharacterized protein LOC131598522 [Vicia villosa]|uniref:uncharacterized protein LOC131598522 n=1 Tax=Vicia villosa TaxID=3911 RepID=UPI00273B8EAB|nr:uncharacterized protein LOC131598522 [Vicia villosa]
MTIIHEGRQKDHELPDDEAVHEVLDASEAQKESVVDAPLKSNPGGTYDTSLLRRYADHAAGHNRPCLKSINHDRKIFELVQPNFDWFRDLIRYSGLVDLCDAAYMTINDDMYMAFAEK